MSNDASKSPDTTVCAGRSIVTWFAGSAAIAVSSATSSALSAIGSNPTLYELPRKMSANDGAMIARNPRSSSAHGACSRDDPEPKFGPETSTTASEYSGRLRMNSGVQFTLGVLRPIPEEERTEAGALNSLEELLRDDLIGVDVGPGEWGHLAGDDGDGLHQDHSRMSTKWPSIAAAAAIAGLTRWVRPSRPWRPSKLRFDVEAHRSPG